ELERDLESVRRAEEAAQIRTEDRRLLVPVEAIDPDPLGPARADSHRRLVGGGGLPHLRRVLGAQPVAMPVADLRIEADPAADEPRIREEEELVLVARRSEDQRDLVPASALAENGEGILARNDGAVAEDGGDVEHAAEIPRRGDGQYLGARLAAQIRRDL